MKKLTLLILVLLICNANMFAQSGRFFSTYSRDDTSSDVFTDVYEFNNKFYTVGQNYYDLNFGMLKKYSAKLGTDISTKYDFITDTTIEETPFNNIIMPQGTSNLLITGAVGWHDSLSYTFIPSLIKTDTNGNVIWYKTYENILDEYNVAGKIIQLSENRLAIACGAWEYKQNYGSRMLMLIVDTSGNLIRKAIFNPFQDENSFVNNIIKLANGDLLLVGMNWLSDRRSTGIIMRLDTALNIIWEKKYNDSFKNYTNLTDVVQKKNGNILVTGYMNYTGKKDDLDAYLIEIGKDSGNVIREKRFDPAKTNYVSSIALLANENIVLGGDNNDNDSTGSNVAIWKLDTNWNVIWYHQYTNTINPSYDEGLYVLKQTQDKGFVCTGGTGVNFDYTAFILKLDSNGCLQEGCNLVGIEEVSSTKDPIQFYPNPANEKIVFNNLPEQGSVSLYSIQGVLVLKENTTNSSIELNTSSIQPGMYIIQIEGVNNDTLLKSTVVVTR